jgi:hypothetical protein
MQGLHEYMFQNNNTAYSLSVSPFGTQSGISLTATRERWCVVGVCELSTPFLYLFVLTRRTRRTMTNSGLHQTSLPSLNSFPSDNDSVLGIPDVNDPQSLPKNHRAGSADSSVPALPILPNTINILHTNPGKLEEACPKSDHP